MIRDVTVIIPVLNEEQNLPAALASLTDVTRVIVVDSGSTDRTREIALASGAEVVNFSYRPGGPKKKAWALGTLPLATKWILLLDADERVSTALWIEIDRVLQDPSSADGYYLDREFHFMGRVMRSFQPNWNMRLFQVGRGRIEDLGLSSLPKTGDNEIHEHVQVTGRTGYLRTPLVHDDYRTLTEWLDRHNKYATWEAHLYLRFQRESVLGQSKKFGRGAFARKRLLRRIWVRMPFRPPLRFVIWYVFRGGFLDGREGFYFCVLMGVHEFVIGLKLRELHAGHREVSH